MGSIWSDELGQLDGMRFALLSRATEQCIDGFTVQQLRMTLWAYSFEAAVMTRADFMQNARHLTFAPHVCNVNS